MASASCRTTALGDRISHLMQILFLLAASFLFTHCGEKQKTAYTPVTRTQLEEFTQDPVRQHAPAFSPDGQWILFSSLRSGNEDLWKKPVAGGEARQLAF